MRVERPWGWYESLTQGDNYLVKRLLVRAGQQLSLQRHRHRSESWTVVSGSGALLCGDIWHPGPGPTARRIPPCPPGCSELRPLGMRLTASPMSG